LARLWDFVYWAGQSDKHWGPGYWVVQLDLGLDFEYLAIPWGFVYWGMRWDFESDFVYLGRPWD
jgi:hypothetical protein